MMRISTLLATALFMATGVQAQQQSRLVGVHRSVVNNVVLEPEDSARVIYNTNARGMDATDWDYRYYNPVLQADTMINYGYNNGQLFRYTIDQMKYNTDNLLTEWMVQIATGLGPNDPMVNYTKRTYDYDANGNLTKQVQQKWNTTTNAWDNEKQQIWTYVNGNVETDTRQQWVNGAWANEQQSSYTYNANNKVLNYLYKAWNTATNTLTIQNQTLYGYDANGHFISYTAQNYDLVNMTYTDTYRELHTNDANGMVIETITQQWNNGAGQWDTSNKLTYTYNSSGWNTNDTFETWDAVNGVWKPTLTYEYLYDANGNNTSYTLQLWNVDSAKYLNSQQLLYDFNSYDQMTRYQTLVWNSANAQWEPGSNDRDNHYYYELYTTGIKNADMAAATLKLYPVPARDRLHINMQWQSPHDFYVTITDMQGRPVRRWQEHAAKSYSKEISLSGMAAGTYFITVGNAEQSSTQPFVITQ